MIASRIKLKFMLLCGLAVLYAALWLWPPDTVGASCRPWDIAEAMQRETAVFSGKVQQIQPRAIRGSGSDVDLVLFAVDKVWKGVEHSQVILRNPSQFDRMETSIDMRFVVGESYLVFAQGDDNALRTTQCSGTKFIAWAADDLAYLGEGSVPAIERDLSDQLKRRGFDWQTVAAGAVLLAAVFGGGLWLGRRGQPKNVK